MRSSSAASLLKEITSKKESPACIVITSPDRVRRERALEFLIKHFVETSAPKPRALTLGDSNRPLLSAFIRDLEEPSLFEPSRFAILRGIDSAKAVELEPLSEFLRKKIPGVYLFIVSESLPNVPTFKKVLESHAQMIVFDALKGAELKRWIEREASQKGLTGADDEIIELLSSLGSEDPEAIANLVEKFSLYLGDAKPSRQALRALEPGRAVASDFELAETLIGKNRASTETLLLQLLSQGSSPFMLLGLLTKTFTTLYRMRALVDKGLSQSEIKNSLGISPWLFSKYQPLAQRLSAHTLESAVAALFVADFRLKDRSLGPAAIMSSLASRTAPQGAR